MPFKKGDRVRYMELNDTYTGTITRSGEPRDTWWVCWDDGTDESLMSGDELDLFHTKFKVGDRVSMWIRADDTNYTGTITRQHERNATKWWVRWDDDKKELWTDENSLTLIPQSENQEQAPESSHKFSVGELKAILSKMDDDIVISVTDFRISFKS